MNKISAEVEILTMDQIDELLESKIQMRSLLRSVVGRYVESLNAGTFDGLNGETIKIDKKNRLIDGQHRLEAIRKFGKPVKLLVVRGLEPEAFDTIDTGKSRTISDVFGAHGIANANATARASKLLLVWDQEKDEIIKSKAFNFQLFRKLDHHRIFEFYLKNKQLIDLYIGFNVASKNKAISKFGKGLLTFCSIVLSRIDQDKAYIFFETLRTGITKSKEWRPLIQARDEVLSDQKKAKSLQENFKASLIFGLWNVIYHKADMEAIANENFNIPLELTRGNS